MFLFIFFLFVFSCQKVKNTEFLRMTFPWLPSVVIKKIYEGGKSSRYGILFRLWIRLMFSLYVLISKDHPQPQFGFIQFLFFKHFTFSNL